MPGQSQRAERPRGCQSVIGRGLKGFGLILLALLLLGAAYQAIATEQDRTSYPPGGQLYDVGGHEMHLICVGEDSPTVILEAGVGHFSAMWAWVQPAVAESYQVCAYDRAGYGWSEPAPAPRDAEHFADELHTLLGMAESEPPYMLVGHSAGGIYTRVYRARYADEVVGMVLLDATHPDNWTRQGESLETIQSLARVSSVLSRVGLMRLYVGSENFALPAPDNASLKADMASSEYWNTQLADMLAAADTLARGRAAADLGRLPLAVLAALTYPEGKGRDTERALQSELAALSSNSLYQEIEGAGHISLVTDPQFAAPVSEAILRVVESAQTGEPLAQ